MSSSSARKQRDTTQNRASRTSKRAKKERQVFFKENNINTHIIRHIITTMGTLTQVEVCKSILQSHPDAVACYMHVPGGASFYGSDFILFIRGPEGLEGDLSHLHCNKNLEQDYLNSKARPTIESCLRQTSIDGHQLYKDIVYGRDDYLQLKKSELNNGSWRENVNRLSKNLGYGVEVGTWRSEAGLCCLGVFVKSTLTLRKECPAKAVYQYYHPASTQITC